MARSAPATVNIAPIFVWFKSGPTGNTAVAKNNPNVKLEDAASAMTTSSRLRTCSARRPC
ncbi:MAG TPA: hypothetical protein VJN70_13230 [Gemmatimonadaceae bacterium]|nr:hypothetical protein [Gemmatimonadaceae bacterium]